MGAQSIKIPVELEIQSLQGEVSRMRKMLGELKPNTKAFQDLEKRIDKVNHSLISFENRSKQTFSNQSEITNFSKSFDKIGLAIQDIYTEFQRLDFKDLQLSSSDPSVQQIENLKKSISGLEQQIKEIDKEILSDDNIISPDTIQTVKTLDASFDTMKSTIKDALGLLETELNSTNKEISAVVKNSQRLEDAYEKAAEAEDRAKANRDKTKQREAFGRNDLLRANQAKKENNFEQARNLALQYHMSTQDLNRVNESALNKLSDKKRIQTINEFYDRVITLVETKVQKLKDATVEAEDSVSKAVAETTSAFDKYADEEKKFSNLRTQKDTYESAKLNLEAGQQEGANRVQNYNNQIQNLIHSIAQLVQQLQQSNIVTKEANKGQQETADTIKIAGDKIEESTDQINHLTEAEEKLGNIKNAIKNWFGFNEVINISKNAVRNTITQIRELDDVMTQIAIVTDMTQQELWDQMDTYSAMAQQYGASIKGVYEVSQLYYQQGLQTAEVMNLTEETLKMAKIANLDYAEATDYMTVALRGFKLEMSDAQQVTDVYSALAAATASDTEELAVAMSKTASSAEAVGSSFESTSAMIATMISITREAPENFSGAYKKMA